MEWLREWIWQIAGIIILSAICDMIVPGGAMKKYVRMVFGLVLVVAVIRPVVNIPDLTITQIKDTKTQQNAAKLKSQLSEKEQFNVIKLYKEKLCENIKNELNMPTDIKTDVKVEIEDKNEREFGTIKTVTLILHTNSKIEDINIKNTITQEFGISPENINIIILSDTA